MCTMRTEFNINKPSVNRITVDRTVIALATREMSLEEIIRQYRKMIRYLFDKTGCESDLVRKDGDRIN